MRVLIFNNLYSPNQVGGAEKSVQILAEELAAQGHDVHVACLNASAYEAELNGVQVHYLKHRNIYKAYTKGGRTPPAPLRLLWHLVDSWNPFQWMAAKALMRQIQPDIVHTNNLGGFSVSVWHAARSLNLPIVHTTRDYYLSCPKTTRFKRDTICDVSCGDCQLLSKSRLRSSRYVDTAVGISKYISDKHAEQGYFPNAVARHVVYNKTMSEPAAPTSSDRGSQVFGFVGQLSDAKGIETLIHAFNRVPNANLKIFGKAKDDAYLDHLISMVSNPNVTFEGFQPTATIYPQLDYLCVPSLWEEPFGRVIIEANAVGVPVLASKRGGMIELIEPGNNGLLVESTDDGWVNAIEQALTTHFPIAPAPLESPSYERVFEQTLATRG